MALVAEENNQTSASNLVSASRSLRIIYCLAIVAVLPSMLFGGAGWISLVTGGGLLAKTGLAGFAVILVLVLIRIVRVIRVPSTLDARVTGFVLGAIRR